MTAPLLRAEHVVVSFGGVTAVNDVSFDIARGEVFAIIGPNGAGKTTLLNALNGLVKSSGTIEFDGQTIAGAKVDAISRAGIGRTFQNLGLFGSMTVLENVLVGSQDLVRSSTTAGLVWWGRARREEIEIRKHAHAILDLVGLADIADEPVDALPYGTRKRVELAKAVAARPRLLLLDEPVAGMNREETEELIAHVFALKREFGLTLAMIEHDVHLIMDIADRILALDFGQMIGLGSPEETQANPRIIEAYLGAEFAAERVEVAS